MRQRDRTFVRLHHNGLRIQQRRIARRRIARVPNGQRAAHLGQHIFGKNVRDRSHGLMRMQSHAIGSNNSRGFLPAMLQSMQAQVGELLRLGVGENRDHSALIVKFVGIGMSAWL